jgi:hypothetical protein
VVVIFPGLGDLAGGLVGEAAVRAAVVAVDVGADRGAGLVEGLEFLAPDAAQLAFAEGLALGVAVAVAAVDDPELAEPFAERAGGAGAAVVSAERQSTGRDAALDGRGVDDRDRLGGRGSGGRAPSR